MQDEAEVIEVGLPQLVVHDVQRRPLLGYEQHRLSPAYEVGDNVRDRLRLACARRPL